MEGSIGTIRVRIAPSPTGYLHIGNVRTAIFNWAFARQNGGKFILRIEDTDKERSEKEYEDDVLEGLRWLGLEWDEGPDKGGGFGPYRQSERTDIYKKYLEKLLNDNRAYWCFCTKEELEAEKQAMMASGMAPKYSGRCRGLGKSDAEEMLKNGKGAVIRFRTPEGIVEFNDFIRGKVRFDASLLGDMVIAKNLETPLYNFSAVVDDYEMKITHVIRGEDHLANTPKQILIQKALGFDEPIYAHVPLILSRERSKLSKRAGDTALRDYKRGGYAPEALVNFLVLLGWHPHDDKETLSAEEILKNFNLKKVQKSGAVFDGEKLQWFNAYYIKNLSMTRLLELVKDFVPDEWFKERRELLVRALEVEKTRMKFLTDFKDLAGFFFELPHYGKDLLIWNTMSAQDTLRSLGASLDILEKYDVSEMEGRIVELADKIGRGEVLWPLRAALTGVRVSPPPWEVIKVLGREESARRLKIAMEKLNE